MSKFRPGLIHLLLLPLALAAAAVPGIGAAANGVPVPQVGADDQYVYVGYNTCPVVSPSGPLQECSGPYTLVKVPLGDPCTVRPEVCDPTVPPVPPVPPTPCQVGSVWDCNNPCAVGNLDPCSDPCQLGNSNPCNDPCQVGNVNWCSDCGVLSYDPCEDPCRVGTRNVCEIPDPCVTAPAACNPPPPPPPPCQVGNVWDCNNPCAVGNLDPCNDPCQVGNSNPCNDPCQVGNVNWCSDCGVLSYDPCEDPCRVGTRNVCEIPDPCPPVGGVDPCNPTVPPLPPVWVPIVTGDLYVCKQYLDGTQGECILHVPLP